MFLLAIVIALYGEGIFLLGIYGLLFPKIILFWTVITGILLALALSKLKAIRLRFSKERVAKASFLCLVLLTLVNLVGVLGPETSFDALWYHLTLPKLFLLSHRISFIPGGLFYYSIMPKLGEMFFIPALVFGNEIIAKAIQYFFGLLTVFALYKLSRRFLSPLYSLLVCVIFYSNIVVAWESSVAYIDIIRTFFEVMTLWGFILWVDTKEKKWLYMSSLFCGFAITTKLLALGSSVIFTLLISIVLWKQKIVSVKRVITNILVYWFLSILVVLPWLVFSYLSTGNPFYPFFTSTYPVSAHYAISFLPDFFRVFLFSDDPISPLYIIVLPLVIFYFSSFRTTEKLIGCYAFIALFLWYVTPQTGGGRFILPYLPAFSLLVGIVMTYLKKENVLYKTIFGTVFFLAVVTIMYRGIANSRYLPVIFGQQTKADFLRKHLHFSFGDFYDTDGYFKKTIRSSDTVLLFGFHNLYYADFPFIDSSYIKKGDKFIYIATQNAVLPNRFSDWKLLYTNLITHVKLYNKQRTVWEY